MHRTVVGHIDITIGRDRQLFASLGIAIDIDDELVTRAQHIVLRGGNVHHRLEGQVLVVEDIATEDFLAGCLLYTEVFFTRRLTGLFPIQHVIGDILHHLLLSLLLVCLIRGIVLAHA